MFRRKKLTQSCDTKLTEEVLARLAKKLPLANWIILMDQDATILVSIAKEDLPPIENLLPLVIGAYSIEERFLQETKKGSPTYLLFANEADMYVMLPLPPSHFLILELPIQASVDSSVQILLQFISSLA